MAEPKPIERLAGALQACLHEAAEQGAERAVGKMRAEMREFRTEVREHLDRQDVRLDRQDEALRLMWRQMKGNGRFPLD